jgi:hypothetical protein
VLTRPAILAYCGDSCPCSTTPAPDDSGDVSDSQAACHSVRAGRVPRSSSSPWRSKNCDASAFPWVGPTHVIGGELTPYILRECQLPSVLCDFRQTVICPAIVVETMLNEQHSSESPSGSGRLITEKLKASPLHCPRQVVLQPGASF